MTRNEYANIKNWKGTATRLMAFNEEQTFVIGDVENFGLSWTDGGEFTPETYGKYQYVIEIIEDTEGHKVDYDNEEECEELSCEDCGKEKEILINKDFTIVKVYDFDEEIGFGRILVK